MHPQICESFQKTCESFSYPTAKQSFASLNLRSVQTSIYSVLFRHIDREKFWHGFEIL